jgi:pyrimidine operon attenuation protein/uracil phosphoribosyltransferase
MRRTISRIAHEIIERNADAEDLLLVGLQSRCSLAATVVRETARNS